MQNHMGQYGTMQDHTVPYGTIKYQWDHTRRTPENPSQSESIPPSPLPSSQKQEMSPLIEGNNPEKLVSTVQSPNHTVEENSIIPTVIIGRDSPVKKTNTVQSTSLTLETVSTVTTDDKIKVPTERGSMKENIVEGSTGRLIEGNSPGRKINTVTSTSLTDEGKSIIPTDEDKMLVSTDQDKKKSEQEDKKPPPKLIVLKAPTKLDNPSQIKRKKKEIKINTKSQTKKKEIKIIPKSHTRINDIFKRLQKNDENETPCISGQVKKKITKPLAIEMNTTDGEVPCVSSDVCHVVGESSSSGSAKDKPDLATKQKLTP